MDGGQLGGMDVGRWLRIVRQRGGHWVVILVVFAAAGLRSLRMVMLVSPTEWEMADMD